MAETGVTDSTKRLPEIYGAVAAGAAVLAAAIGAVFALGSR